jgi:dihydrofolate reductase
MTATQIAQINVSLDGYIENDDHEIDWQFVDAEYDEFILQTLRSLDAMVFGRKAYKPLSRYWPTAAGNPDATPVDLARRADGRRRTAAARLGNGETGPARPG